MTPDPELPARLRCLQKRVAFGDCVIASGGLRTDRVMSRAQTDPTVTA